MVRHYFPQTAGGSSVIANTNYPPQSGTENIGPPPVVFFEAFNDGLGDSGIVLYNDGLGESGSVLVVE